MVNKADAFFYNGLTLDDDFADKMSRNHRNRSLKVANLGEIMQDIDPKLILDGEGKECVHADGTRHKHGKYDPHIWLGPPQAIEMTKIVRDKLSEIDPANKAGYEARAAKFIEQLKELEAHGQAAFKDKKNKKIVTMHEAFAYFATAFDIQIVASIQMQPGMDSDAVSMQKLIALCREPDGPRVIAKEPQYPAAQAERIRETLQREGIEVRIISLDPLETADVAKGQTFNPDPGHYLKKMRENIDTLAEALR
jgi:ABC-type Zn uptake system ZnuABC Zn-binding protein ZnuA